MDGGDAIKQESVCEGATKGRQGGKAKGGGGSHPSLEEGIGRRSEVFQTCIE